MLDLMQNGPFKLYALSVAVLTLNLLVLSGLTGARRGKHKSLANPEDSGYQDGAAEHAEVSRVIRAHRNANENILPYFAVAAVFLATGPSQQTAMIYFGTFTVARILHSIMYLAGKQPFRTIFYAIGALTTAGMVVQIIMKAI